MKANTPRKPQIAFISVGSNIGDKKENCLRAIELIAEKGHTELVAKSAYYQTSPVDNTNQEWFVNAVVKVSTSLDPFGLLDELLAIEDAMGRQREGVPRFGPRIIDLDLIFYGQQWIESPRLVVPHPRMQKRRFVLAPICDIDPELSHPISKKTMRQLMEDPDVYGQEIITLEDDNIINESGGN